MSPGSQGRWGEDTLSHRAGFALYLACVLACALPGSPPSVLATGLGAPPTPARLDPGQRLVALPFAVGEELVFDIGWMGLRAGQASMAVSGQVTRDGHEVYHITLKAQSSPFLSLFYPVNDLGETYLDVRGLYPWYYHLHQREGTRVARHTVTFDQKRGLAIYTKNEGTPKEVEVPPEVQDSVSSFYLLRTLPLEVGQPTTMHTFANGRTHEVVIDILRREKIDVYWGSVETLVVRPALRFQEILRQKGDVLIWLTDDARRIPVQMKTAVKVGTVEAKLIDVRGAR